MRAYRHGDLALIEIAEIPINLKKSDSKVLMTGSGGNDHVFNYGNFYPTKKGGVIVGYLKANDKTKLYHLEHGDKIEGKNIREAKIQSGVYELRKQQEDTNEGVKPVVD